MRTIYSRRKISSIFDADKCRSPRQSHFRWQSNYCNIDRKKNPSENAESLSSTNLEKCKVRRFFLKHSVGRKYQIRRKDTSRKCVYSYICHVIHLLSDSQQIGSDLCASKYNSNCLKSYKISIGLILIRHVEQTQVGEHEVEIYFDILFSVFNSDEM